MLRRPIHKPQSTSATSRSTSAEVMRSGSSEQERLDLHRRLGEAFRELPDAPAPRVVVDLGVFDANAADLVRRAAGKPIRLASKSVRIPALISRALATPGFRGVLSYQLSEAVWLARADICDDIVMGYPSLDRAALRELVSDPVARERVTIMVDDPAHLDAVDAVRPHNNTSGSPAPVRVALDIDAGLRVGRAHVGPKRSPLATARAAAEIARSIHYRPGFRLVGVMTYEGQVAGVPDTVPGERLRSFAVRRMKQASNLQLQRRRKAVNSAIRAVSDLEFWNAGGSGSVETTVADRVVTEVAAGSGLLVPGLFDHYASFTPRPAAFFGLPVVRRPNAETATVAGGGFIASGPTGPSRAPLPWTPPGLKLTELEGAGEVQTPLVGGPAGSLRIGEWVWFRHAKSGELAEHANLVHLLQGSRVVARVPSYRGLGHAW